MKAYRYTRYGQPADVLEEVDLPEPVPAAGEILVRMKAVSLNGSDYEITTGYPIYSRIFGILRPRFQVLGSDVAGVVEAVGPGVSAFAVGDRVFGDVFERWGGFAEYLTAPADKMLMIPDGMTFATASALPQSGTNALQPIRDAGLTQGQRVLINGACGSAGPFAIQLAKAAGAHVTAVDRSEKLDLASALGADEVIDFQTQDFTDGSTRYDLILDYPGSRSMRAIRRVLAPRGIYMFFGGSMKALASVLTLGTILSRKGGPTYKLEAVTQTVEKQAEIAGLVQSGALRAVIDRTYPFDDLPDALTRLGKGEARGKIVVTFSDDA
jgi:NADPH:quinone reductase-like Zn-dependent oxidoreductase